MTTYHPDREKATEGFLPFLILPALLMEAALNLPSTPIYAFLVLIAAAQLLTGKSHHTGAMLIGGSFLLWFSPACAGYDGLSTLCAMLGMYAIALSVSLSLVEWA